MGKRMVVPGVLAVTVATGIVLAQQGRPPRDSDAVLAAVFRQEIDGLADTENRNSILCLRVDGETLPRDPSDSVLQVFATDPRVRRVSACTTDASGAFETLTRKAAVVLGAGPVIWVSDNEAEVAGSFFRSSVGFTRPSYRVIKKESRWVSLGPTWKYDPL